MQTFQATLFTWFAGNGQTEASEFGRKLESDDPDFLVQGRTTTKRFSFEKKLWNREDELEAVVYKSADGKHRITVWND